MHALVLQRRKAPMQTLKLERITSYEAFARLENEWNKLLSQSHHDCVFLRHEWFRTWWHNFGNDKTLLILLVRENGGLVGIAPLMQVRGKVGKIRISPVRQIRFIENGAYEPVLRLLSGNGKHDGKKELQKQDSDSRNVAKEATGLESNHVPSHPA